MVEILQNIKDELTEIESELDDTSPTTEELYVAAPTLMTLPVEIILKICTFLDAKFVSCTFTKVCKRFEEIFSDRKLWRYWVYSKMENTFPPLPKLKVWRENNTIDWEELCIDIDSERLKWNNVTQTMQHIRVKDVHFASVDAVLLVQNGEICVSGGRDRGLALWNVSAIRPEGHYIKNKPGQIRHDAHSGWVWDLAADRPESARVVYSASWDNTVKAWDLECGLTCIHTFRCGVSALSVVTSENVVMAGLYTKKILAFDMRVGADPITTYKPHKGPVLALEHHENKIASVSEDRTLSVWDRVAGKLLTTDLKLPTDRAFPVCITWEPSAMYIGDSKGALHMIHPEELTYLDKFQVWPEKPFSMHCSKVSGCLQNLGNLIVCSDRGEFKFFYNCFPPKEYSTFRTNTMDVTQLRYMNEILVIGTCESALEFWIPNERFTSKYL